MHIFCIIVYVTNINLDLELEQMAPTDGKMYIASAWMGNGTSGVSTSPYCTEYERQTQKQVSILALPGSVVPKLMDFLLNAWN